MSASILRHPLRITLWLLALSLLAFSCKEEKQVSYQHFNIDSLISAQVVQLTAKKGKLTKWATLDSKEDSATTIPASEKAWWDELSIFSQLNAIGKPVFAGQYRITDGQKDTKTNLTVRTYIAREGGKMGVPYVTIYYQDTPDKIRRIEGVYIEKNVLYSSSRFLRMELQDIYNKSVLTSYSVTGGQKMILSDSVMFSVSGNIVIP